MDRPVSFRCTKISVLKIGGIPLYVSLKSTNKTAIFFDCQHSEFSIRLFYMWKKLRAVHLFVLTHFSPVSHFYRGYRNVTLD